MRILFIICALICSAGCIETPKDRFNDFLHAIHQKDADAFLNCLDSSSRALVRKELHLAKARASLSGDGQAAEADVQQVLMDGFVSLRGIEDIRELKRDDREAWIEVTDFDHQSQRFHLVRQDESWKINLLSMQQPTAVSPK